MVNEETPASSFVLPRTSTGYNVSPSLTGRALPHCHPLDTAPKLQKHNQYPLPKKNGRRSKQKQTSRRASRPKTCIHGPGRRQPKPPRQMRQPKSLQSVQSKPSPIPCPHPRLTWAARCPRPSTGGSSCSAPAPPRGSCPWSTLGCAPSSRAACSRGSC